MPNRTLPAVRWISRFKFLALLLLWLEIGSVALSSPISTIAAPALPVYPQSQNIGAARLAPDNAARLTIAHTLAFKSYDLVLALSWSPDGKSLAVSAGEHVDLYQADGWARTRSLETGVWSRGLAFSPDGAWLASVGYDGAARVWDTGSWELASTWPAHKKIANSVAWSPDSSRLATAGNDAMARIWEPGAGELLTEVIGGTYAIPAVLFTPDGKGLAIANGDVVRIRAVEDGRFLQTLREENAGSFFSLAYLPGQDVLATGSSENRVALWDVGGQALRLGFEGHAGLADSPSALVWQVAFSPDGRLLASAGGDRTIRVSDAASGALLATLVGHRQAVTALSFSPDGLSLASGSLDASVHIWQVQGD